MITCGNLRVDGNLALGYITADLKTTTTIRQKFYGTFINDKN